MAPIQEPKTVRYCFECGHKIDPSRDGCWYCGTQLRRTVRPPRTCQFCGSEIPHGAVKCRHCGEWVDGRPADRRVPQQVVFVVDRELLGSMRDFQLLGGNKVPPDIAAHLSSRTVQAIESGQPRMLDAPGVRALPAPDSDDDSPIIEVPAESHDLIVTDRKSAPRESRELQARNTDLAPTGEAPHGGALMSRLGQALIKSSPAYRKHQPAPSNDIDADAGDLYLICEKCGAEILRSDNYCYHCGVRYHKSAIDLRHEREQSFSGNFGLFLVTIVLILLMAGVNKFGASPLLKEFSPSMIALGIGATAILFSLLAFVRRPGALSRIISIVLILATVYLYLTI